MSGWDVSLTRPPKDMVAVAKAWRATRERILTEEADTGYLDIDAIQASDDDAVEIAQWVADGML